MWLLKRLRQRRFIASWPSWARPPWQQPLYFMPLRLPDCPFFIFPLFAAPHSNGGPLQQAAHFIASRTAVQRQHVDVPAAAAMASQFPSGRLAPALLKCRHLWVHKTPSCGLPLLLPAGNCCQPQKDKLPPPWTLPHLKAIAFPTWPSHHRLLCHICFGHAQLAAFANRLAGHIAAVVAIRLHHRKFNNNPFELPIFAASQRNGTSYCGEVLPPVRECRMSKEVVRAPAAKMAQGRRRPSFCVANASTWPMAPLFALPPLSPSSL